MEQNPETCTYTYGDGSRCLLSDHSCPGDHPYVHEHMLVDPEPEFDIDAADPAGFVTPGGDGTLHPIWARLTPEALNEVGERVAQVLEDYRPEITLTPSAEEGAPDPQLEEALIDAAADVAWQAYCAGRRVTNAPRSDRHLFDDGFHAGLDYERMRRSL